VLEKLALLERKSIIINIINSFLKKKPDLRRNDLATIGIDFSSIKYGLLMEVQLYDNGGQRRYRSMVEQLYSGVNSIILIYDITDKESFEECKNYYKVKIKDLCKNNIPIILIGNKSDLEDKREVTKEEGFKFASKNKYMFKETSCLKNEKVYEAFEEIILETYFFKIRDKENIDKKENCQIF